MLRHSLRLAAFATALLVHARTAGAQQVPSAAEPTLEKKSLDDCVATALARNVDVLTSKEETSVAEAQKASARGHFGPKVHLEASYERWNEAYVFGGFPVH